MAAREPVPSAGARDPSDELPGPPRIQVGIDCLDPVGLAPFWLAALGYRGTSGDAAPYLTLEGPPGALSVFLQKVPERKSVKNRLHLDLYTDRPEQLCRRLEAAGAKSIGPPFGDVLDWDWQVMADPEGNEFCVCRERSEP